VNKRDPLLLDKHEGYNRLPEKSDNEQAGENKNKSGKYLCPSRTFGCILLCVAILRSHYSFTRLLFA
jgi:hypothetical protein